MKLSFKNEPKETGLRAVCYSPGVIIKANKKQIGRIYHQREVGFRVSITVPKEKTEESPAPFQNIFFKATFDNREDAKEWVKKNWNAILEKYPEFHFFED